MVTIFITFVYGVIAVKTLKEYCKAFPQAEQPLRAWYEEVQVANWNSPNELNLNLTKRDKSEILSAKNSAYAYLAL